MKKVMAVLIIVIMLLMAYPVQADISNLKSQTSKDIGLSLSTYRYQEPGIMSSSGGKIGLDLRSTRLLRNERFIRGELRYAFGTVDYSSNNTGSASGQLDWYIEARGLVGKDWVTTNAVLSPYMGLGYRYLFNDARGLSCTGGTCFWGYRRESNYFYLPIGITHRSSLKGQARLVSTLEYDHLLAGTQVSRLSDGGWGDSDLTNSQRSGRGLKLSLMYEKDNWAIGPFAHFWDIGQSDWVPRYRNGVPVLDINGRPLGGVEPQNDTVEIGLKASQRF